jgi:hypothetical protein
MAISVEKRTTPYFDIAYSEQIEKKKEWLLSDAVLKDFTRKLED